MTLAYDVYTEDDVLIGRMEPSTEIIVGMMKTQFLPDGDTKFIKGIQEGPVIWDEAHALRLGRIECNQMLMTYPPKDPTEPKRNVRIRQTMGTADMERQYPAWNMV